MKSKNRLSRRQFGAGLLTFPAIASLPGVARSQPVPSAPLGSDPFAVPITFERDAVALTAKPLNLDHVLLGRGPLQQASDWNTAYLKRLDPERLLHAFRLNAGLASSAQPLGGWEAPKCELRGHFAGHYLSALAIGYATTRDSSLRERGEAMVKALADCQARLNLGGYLSAFPVEYFARLETTGKVWAPFYTVHKIMAGLLDMYRHAGSAEALRVLTGMANWVDEWTASRPPDRMQTVLKVEFGGMGDLLYEMAAVTGEDRFARIGDRFIRPDFLSPLALNQDQLRGLHANTHIPQVIAAARRYELSSDARYRHIAEFFWETVVGSRSYVTGGSSNREHWKTSPHQLAVEWRDAAEHQECCCAYNMLKLTRHLFGWRPQARYMDYYERVLFNHRLGTIDPATGRTLYFLSLTPGAWKAPGLETDTFWCCNGTALEEFAKLGDTIYYRDTDGLWVNLFVASRLDWRERGVELVQETQFPHEERTTLTFARAPGTSWNLRIRIPGWAANARILVNGKAIDAIAVPGSYANIARRWKQGDRVVVELPMKLSRETMADDPAVQAYLFGPIVLAGQFPKGAVPPDGDRMKAPDLVAAPCSVPTLPVRTVPPEKWLVRADRSSLTWRTRGLDTEIEFKPLFESWERYAVYWRTA
jgi:uncharacterized protein